MKQGAKPGGGQSPLARLRSGRALLGVLMGAVVAVGIFGYVGIPSFTGMVNSALSGGIPGIIDRIQDVVSPTPVIERPVRDELTATSEVEDHPVLKLFDRYTNTDWRGGGETPSVTATFASKVELLSVIVHSGSADKDFVDLRRPAKLEFVFPDGGSTTVTLEDVHTPQTFELRASGVDKVTIRVLGSYGPASAPVSISEIEFFRKG